METDDRIGRVWRSRSFKLAGAALATIALVTGIGFAVSTSHRSTGSSASSTSSGASSGASSGSSSGARSAVGVAPVPESAPQAAAASGSPSSGSSSAGTSGGTDLAVPIRSARVIQTGQISLGVRPGQVQPTLDRLGTIAIGAGGYVSDSKSEQGDGTPSGATTIRVPVARFASVEAQVRRVGHVVSISTQATDVTATYVDLSARIDALSQTRATYLTLLSRATSIGDTLAVQQQIQQVQTQLEQLQGQQKVLADSSDLATLAVSITETGAAAPPPVTHKPSGFGKAWHEAASGFNTGLKAIIRIAGPMLLVVLVVGLIALIGYLGRVAYRRIKPSTNTSASASSEG
jgi:hypothetical protein